MKLKVGTRLKCRNKLDLKGIGKCKWEKGEKCEIIEFAENLYFTDKDTSWTENDIKRSFKILKPKTIEEPKKEEIPTKHIRFSWMKDTQGKLYKTMLGVIGDKRGFKDVESGDKSFNSILNEIIKETNIYFPSMFKTVRRFYKRKGRAISRKDFKVICMGRITMLFSFDKSIKKVVNLNEHPQHNKEKFKDSIAKCLEMIEKKEIYK